MLDGELWIQETTRNFYVEDGGERENDKGQEREILDGWGAPADARVNLLVRRRRHVRAGSCVCKLIHRRSAENAYMPKVFCYGMDLEDSPHHPHRCSP